MFLQVLCKLLNTRAYSRYLVFGRTHVLVVALEVLRSAVVRVISPPCSFAAEKRREERRGEEREDESESER